MAIFGSWVGIVCVVKNWAVMVVLDKYFEKSDRNDRMEWRLGEGFQWAKKCKLTQSPNL